MQTRINIPEAVLTLLSRALAFSKTCALGGSAAAVTLAATLLARALNPQYKRLATEYSSLTSLRIKNVAKVN